MPKINYKLQIINYKFKLQVTALFLLLTSTLSGCSAIGFNKPAALQITSTPEASVFLDGKHLGKTPFFSDQLKEGEHEVKITTDSASFISKINLQKSTLTVINRQLAENFLSQSGEILTLNAGKNGLFVISSPNEATVIVDGKLVGKSPILIEDIEDGEHKVAVSALLYITREFTVKTTAKYQLLAEVTLASQIAKEAINKGTLEPKTIKVEITKTPQGFLRVRQDPITAALEIGRVKPGEEYEVLQEIKDWIKIVFEGKQGWISTEYTKKLP